eukprot:g18681.t2
MLLHARTRLRDFSYEPPRSRAPLTYYYPVRSRSSTPRRRDSPTPRYLNSVKNSYGHLGPAGTGAGGAQSTVPVPTTGTLAPGSGPVPTPTGPVFQTSMAPVYSKTSLAPGAPHSQTLLHIKQVPTPCKLRTEVISSALPTTLAPSGSSYITSKEPGSTDSGGNSLCSTMNRNQVSKSAAAPVPGQSAHSLLGPARQTSMDLVQTIQMTSAELQDCMTKQQQQQMQDKEQEAEVRELLWTFATVLKQLIFSDLNYNEPLVLTYVCNACYAVHFPLHGLLRMTKVVSPIPWRRAEAEGSVKNGEVREAMRGGLIIAPLWFAAQWTYSAGVASTSVTASTVISTTSVVWTLLASILFLKEKVTVVKVLGIICCMAGNAATLLGSDKPDQKGQFSGDLLCIVAAMLYAAYTTVLSRIVQPDFSMAILFGVIGVAILVIGAPLVFSLKQEALRRMTPEIFGLLIFNGIFDNVLSQFCWAKAVQWTSPTTATVGLSLTIPLSILADLVRQKHLTPWTYLAALLVLSGFLQLTKVSLEEKDKAVAKLERELLEKEDELNEIRHDRDEQAGRKEEEVAEREKTILHLQARVECLEQEHTQKDEWCRKRDEAARKLEGTLRSKESSFEAQLAKKDQEPKLRDELSQLSISDVCCLLGTLFSDSFGSDRRNLIHVCYKWTLRNHVLHLMCLRCHEFQEIDMKNHELRERENELRKKDHEIETLKKQVRSLQDQVIIDRQHVEDCNGLQTEMRNTNCALLQERQVRERELQEKSEELTKFLLDLDARSQGDIPSAIKSREASCSSFRLEQLAKSEADLLMLQQWQHAQMAQMA